VIFRPARRRKKGPLARVAGAASFLCFLALLFISVASVRILLTRATANLHVLLKQGLEAALQREVRIGSVKVSRPGVIRFSGIAIADGKTFKDGELFTVQEAVVVVRLSDMLRGKVDPVGSVRSITLEKPTLLVIRRANNRFNLQDLFKKRKKPPQPSPFRALVTLHDGRVTFRDFAVRDLPVPQTNYVTVKSAQLDAGGPPLMTVTASGYGENTRLISATGEGSINPGEGSMGFRIRANTGDAAYWMKYFARLNGMSVLQGRGLATIDVIKSGPFTRASAAVRVDVLDGAATTRYTRVPIRDVAGTVRIVTGRPISIGLDLRGRAAGIPVSVTGSVFPGTTQRVALRAAANGVTMPALRRAVYGVPDLNWLSPLTPASVQAQIYGPPKALEVIGQVQVSRAKLYTAVLSNVRVALRYSNGVADLPSIQAMAGGARVAGSGTIDLKGKTLHFVAGGAGIEARDIVPPALALRGPLTTRVVLSGSTQRPSAEVQIKAGRGRFMSVPFERVSARASVAGRQITIRDGVAELPGATLIASGTATLDGGLGLKVRAANVRLGRFLPAVGVGEVTGTAFVDGRVGGTVRQPLVHGRVEVFNMRVRGQHLDVAAGPVALSGRTVHLNSLVVAQYPAQGIVSGSATIGTSKGTTLNLIARLQTGRLESLLADAHVDMDAEGDVRTTDDIRIGGTLTSPKVSGRVVMTDATIAGYPVNTASAHFKYESGLIQATELEAHSTVGGDGQMTSVRAPLLELRGDKLKAPQGWEARGIRLDRFGGLGAPYAKLTGVVDITNGALSGTRHDPIAAADISISGLRINDLPFDSASTHAAYAGTEVSLSDFSLARGGAAVFRLPHLSYDRDKKLGHAQVQVSSLKLNDIRKALTQSEWYLSDEAKPVHDLVARLPAQSDAAVMTVEGPPGTTGQPLSVDGTLQDLSVAGTVAVAGVQVEGENLSKVSIGGTADKLKIEGRRLVAGTIEIPERGLVAESTDRIDVSGHLKGEIGGSVVAKLEAFNVPLSVVSAFVPTLKNADYTPHGEVSVTVDASGKIDAPDLAASIKAENITFGKVQVPFTIRTGEIDLTNEGGSAMITAKSFRVLTKDHAVVLNGAVPFSWKRFDIPADEPLNFTADMHEQGLDILEVAFGQEQRGPVQSAKGTVTAHLSVAGTKAHPNWSGYVRVQDGSVQLRPFKSLLKDIAADLEFDAASTAIRVKTLSLNSSTGGSMTMLPGSSLKLVPHVDGPSTLEPDISIALKDLNVDEATNGFGLGGERFRGTLDTAPTTPLTIKKGKTGPLVAGSILLSNVDFTPPNDIAAAKQSAQPPAVNPSFDLKLVTGKNVRVGNALYRLVVDEKRPETDRRLLIRGDLEQPRLDGRFTARDGNFNYPTARFRLTDAVVVVHYPAFSATSNTVRPANGIGGDSSPISVAANAQARLMATVNGRREPVTVYMQVEGPSSGTAATASQGAFQSLAPYKITLRSSPSLPQRQLVALISREDALQALAGGTGTPEEVLRQETLNILQASVLPGALQGIESRIGAAFGLETLSVDYLTLDHQVSVTAGKRFGDRLLLTYTKPVGATTSGDAYTISLSYDLGARLRLTLQQQKGAILFGTQAALAPIGQPSVVETQLLLEGSMPF
jgi:hypothetical protein